MTTQTLLSSFVEPMQELLVVEDYSALENLGIHGAIRNILAEIGEDPDRQGLIKTPDRVARMYQELTAGYQTDPEKIINGALFDVEYNEMVLVKDIEFYSLCEHHLLPFFGRAHVAYIPNGKVIGLSKIPRIVEMFARRLQVQERMTAQIAHLIEDTLHPEGVAVIVEGSHMCSMMRGVKKSEATMTTRIMLGAFKDDRQLRDEFIALLARMRNEA